MMMTKTNVEANANATRADVEDGTTTTRMTTTRIDEGIRIVIVTTTMTVMARDEDGIAVIPLMGLRGTDDDAGRGRGEGPVGTKANRRIERRRRRRLRRRRRRIEEHQERRRDKG